MYKTSIVYPAVVFLLFAGICSAQQTRITPEMIATESPLEGAPQAKPGPYHVTRGDFLR